MIKCKLCGKEFNGINNIQKHIKMSHKNDITIEDYYDKFISKINRPRCVFCGDVCSLIGYTKGYKKICKSKNCISKSRATYTIEYGIKMLELSKEDAVQRLDKLNKDRKKSYKKTINKKLKENPNFNKERSHQCKEYWLKRGFNEEESTLNIEYVLNNLHKKTWNKRRNKPELYKDVNTTQIDYWIKKGFNKEEAKEKIKERQETFSRKICIEKYGYKKGLEVFINRQEKWIESLNKNGKLKIGYSEVSQELFRMLENNEYVFYGEKNYEYNITNKKYDYTNISRKKIIEFNGDVYHANPKIFKKCDNPHPYLKHLKSEDIWKMDEYKINLAKEKSFDVLVIWEDEFKENPKLVIEKCKKFLRYE
jgi:hypothetical protein